MGKIRPEDCQFVTQALAPPLQSWLHCSLIVHRPGCLRRCVLLESEGCVSLSSPWHRAGMQLSPQRITGMCVVCDEGSQKPSKSVTGLGAADGGTLEAGD